MVRAAGCVALALSIGVAAEASPRSKYTVAMLRADCLSKQTFRLAFCLGFMTGADHVTAFHNLILHGQNLRLPRHKLFCVPNNATTHQIRAVFLKWTARYPESWHMAASVGFAASMRLGFPCRKP